MFHDDDDCKKILLTFFQESFFSKWLSDHLYCLFKIRFENNNINKLNYKNESYNAFINKEVLILKPEMCKGGSDENSLSLKN